MDGKGEKCYDQIQNAMHWILCEDHQQGEKDRQKGNKIKKRYTHQKYL